jgi:transcriptional regulator
MYIPNIYQIEDAAVIENFIRANGFATIVSPTNTYPVATHIPLDLQIDEQGNRLLWGHVSKGNPHWKQLEHTPQVLAIFLSEVHSYISSSWYNHPNVPTWNYMSVHASGTASILEGENLRKSLSRLTKKYEKDSEEPVSFESMPPSVQRQINGVVGLEIRIEKFECAFKLSQNRNREDLESIISHLKLKDDAGSRLMAQIMEKEILNNE